MTPRFVISKATDGFTLNCQARRLSPNTIRDYSVTLHKLSDFLSDPPVAKITRSALRDFLASQTVSKKTLYNYYIGLSAFFKWCLSENLIEHNPLEGLSRPKPEYRTIEPIPEDHIKAILNAVERVIYTRDSKTINNRLPDRYRNRAIILLLLDTGLRATELCTILNRSLDLTRRSVKIIGKNSKERILYFSPTTAQAIWKFRDDSTTYLFSGGNRTRPMSRYSLRRILERACQRAGVPVYSPHDFRHTFAVNFLRNYPNIYVLQQMLGHATLDMVKRYLAISETDIAEAHRHASPVENWNL